MTDDRWHSHSKPPETAARPFERRRRREDHAAGSSHERWLVSYADFITLLFAFFTTMYAMSTVDAKKFESMVQAMQGAFSGGSGGLATMASSGGAAVARTQLANELGEGSLGEVKRMLSESLNKQVASGLIDLEIDPRGLVISIREAGSFQTGSAELSPMTKPLLDEVAKALVQIGNLVRVEGHTDDVPIRTARYASNWELSTARATAVVAYLVQQDGVPPARLSAAGYAEFHPRVPNDSPEHRALNRRVDIVVLNPQTRAAEEPAPVR